MVACAGSGKTFTAVRRLGAVRSLINAGRGHTALLSFSNAAVEVFGQRFSEGIGPKSPAPRSRICIETFDSFITSKILRPHAHRTMNCTCTPYLLTGGEAFLANPKFRFWPKEGKYPLEIYRVQVECKSGKIEFSSQFQKSTIPIANGAATTARLGEIGAYTHALGRYWAFEVLHREPVILAALAHRYPQIIVDEAQDLGSIHIAILEMLTKAGSQVTLVGDPNQAIFEFCGADGAYLKDYPTKVGVLRKELTINRRSVPRIVVAANCLAKREDKASRDEPPTENGAYFVPYEKGDEARLIEAFQSAVIAAGLRLGNSAILCRAVDRKMTLRNFGAGCGQGATKQFAAAAMARDSASDYQEAFRTAAKAIITLLKDPPYDLYTKMVDTSRNPDLREIRKAVWAFTRDPNTGLPSAALKVESEWHPLLVKRVRALLEEVERKSAYKPTENIGQRLAKAKLPDGPMLDTKVKKSAIDPALRVETVHGVKGESLDAVLYLATKEHLKAMLSGTGTEVGRIGYVALTRARDLFWLGISKADASVCRDSLLQNSFAERDLQSSPSVAAG